MSLKNPKSARPSGADRLLEAYDAHRKALAELPLGADEAARLRGRVTLSAADQARLDELTRNWSEADRIRFEQHLGSGHLMTW